MTWRITFTIECPAWAPTGWDRAIVEHHGHKDGTPLTTRRADIHDWIASKRRQLNSIAWQEVSGRVTSSQVEIT